MDEIKMDEIKTPNDSTGDTSSQEFLTRAVATVGSGLPHPPSMDEEFGSAINMDKPERKASQAKSKRLHAGASKLFGDDYNLTEFYFVVFAACLIALNSGFVNGTTMSGYLIGGVAGTSRNPDSQMVAGFAGSYTNTATALQEHQWERYSYNLCLILSYMFGSFIAAMICPHAKPYVIEPKYGPTFMIGGTFLLAASFLAINELPSRYIFFLVTASNGIQNGIASIYSANLIRCTLTGATTDIAIVIAQAINGNYKGFARGCVLSLIVFFFWLGGILAFWGVREFTTYTLLINAGLFYMCGFTLVFYLVKEVGVSFHDALFGTWHWKKVLKKLDTADGDLTKEKLIQIFDDIDAAGDGSGDIDLDELVFGLKKAEVMMKDHQARKLFRAADENGDGVISREEWESLANKVL
ncbi:hypothetical protein FRACYDRAFT_271644 [Fragilariopsis cylindrus CCMP1102]|uniref:EF-hand domain-containing protein n=1 Tax=Fragilariopsis cylindrus CCMP1102 TaxID=635003 RepID=A0A1E7ET57_9STRA|nr:hypothetical protein FRACYDRAFT_271644 [Fragilariopsis cylindrus CCMP1102]|eukprot:OEU08984.1 hypothetical protein FRACYDRAFT_271644 [Fragilariopsis cylindrus CCMP1102]